MKLATVILAGGEGRRIGGAKPLKPLAGQRLVDRAAALASQWSEIRAIAVRDPKQAGGVPLTCILDEPGIAGPLAGLASALRFGNDHACDAVLTIPVDMPFLPGNLADRLQQGLGPAHAALAGSEGRLHPVCALWRVAALGELRRYVQSGGSSLRGLAEAAGFRAVWWADGEAAAFFNINRLGDLDSAERLLER